MSRDTSAAPIKNNYAVLATATYGGQLNQLHTASEQAINNHTIFM